MESLYLVSPPSHGYSSPLGEYRRMMTFLLCDLPHVVGKVKSFSEILELESLLKSLDSFLFNH